MSERTAEFYPPGSTRKAIAKATDAAHQALHQHAWISRLTLSSLSLQEYHGLLSAYFQFFSSVEQSRLRMNTFGALSLLNCVKALEKDLDSSGVVLLDLKPDLDLNTPTRILSALYVLQGSSFGGRQMNANVQRCHPDAPRNYLELPTDAMVWRGLIEELDGIGRDPSTRHALIAAAKYTFDRFGKFVSIYCETLSATPKYFSHS